MKQKTVLCWHFVKDDGTNRDGIKEELGKWYKVDGEIVPCERGLHGSVDLLDALSFAPGYILRRTEHRGIIVEHKGDKIASSERRALWQIDAKPIVAKWSLSEVDREIRGAKKVYKEKTWSKWADNWLSGKDRSAGSAESAAWSARSAGSWSAWSAESAAESAAWSAARSARLAGLAGSAAWSAAELAAWSARSAGSAARKRQNKQLTALVMKAKP